MVWLWDTVSLGPKTRGLRKATFVEWARKLDCFAASSLVLIRIRPPLLFFPESFLAMGPRVLWALAALGTADAANRSFRAAVGVTAQGVQCGALDLPENANCKEPEAASDTGSIAKEGKGPKDLFSPCTFIV